MMEPSVVVEPNGAMALPPALLRRTSTMKSTKSIPQRHELVSCSHAVAGQYVVVARLER
jgi:hypothetical protein